MRSRWTHLFLLLTLLFASQRSMAVVIRYNDEASFTSAATIASISTFDSLVTTSSSGRLLPETFNYLNIALDGTLYSTDQCTNVCWAGETGFGGFPSLPGLISNAIGDNVLTFGAGQWVTDFGFQFLSGGNSLWEIFVTELDGTVTQFSFGDASARGPFSQYFGFSSAIGIGQILVRDDPSDNGATNWSYDNVARSAILGGSVLPNCLPTNQPGGPISATCPQLGGIPVPVTSVPEPTTLSMISLGLLGVFLRRRRTV